MFWILETEDQIEKFISKDFKEVFIDIIPISKTLHPTQNNVSIIYIRPINHIKGYIVGSCHNDIKNVNINLLQTLLNTFDIIYTLDKKDFLYYFIHKNIIDLNFISKLNLETISLPIYDSLDNNIVPLSKLYEISDFKYEQIRHLFTKPVNKFYNNQYTKVFFWVEQNGLPIKDGFLYTKFNLNTTTTRPANSFNGINFMALPKDSEIKKQIIPHNDILVEFDISAYHVILASKLIGYDFGGIDIHSHFSKLYNTDYKKAKELTFKQLYGGVFEEYKNLEFFKKIEIYQDNLWDTFQYQGWIECPISSHKFYKNDLENMNPQKLFNYLLQNFETANNVTILTKIIKLLKSKKTTIIHYVYDSFLFDVDKTEKNLIEEIQNVFLEENLQIKISYGKSYDSLKSL
jgi:hypothetical protein